MEPEDIIDQENPQDHFTSIIGDVANLFGSGRESTARQDQETGVGDTRFERVIGDVGDLFDSVSAAPGAEPTLQEPQTQLPQPADDPSLLERAGDFIRGLTPGTRTEEDPSKFAFAGPTAAAAKNTVGALQRGVEQGKGVATGTGLFMDMKALADAEEKLRRFDAGQQVVEFVSSGTGGRPARVTPTREQLVQRTTAARESLASNTQEMLEQQNRMQDLPASDALKKIQSGEYSAMDVVKALPELAMTNAPQMVATTVAALLGTAASGNPAVGGIAAGSVGALIEFGASFGQRAQESGVDFNDPEAVDAWLASDEYEQAIEYAALRSFGVGAGEAVGGAILAKVMKPLANGLRATARGRVGTEVLEQALDTPASAPRTFIKRAGTASGSEAITESGGEFTAQGLNVLAGNQEDIDLGEVAIEGAVGGVLGGGAVAVGTGVQEVQQNAADGIARADLRDSLSDAVNNGFFERVSGQAQPVVVAAEDFGLTPISAFEEISRFVTNEELDNISVTEQDGLITIRHIPDHAPIPGDASAEGGVSAQETTEDGISAQETTEDAAQNSTQDEVSAQETTEDAVPPAQAEELTELDEPTAEEIDSLITQEDERNEQRQESAVRQDRGSEQMALRTNPDVNVATEANVAESRDERSGNQETDRDIETDVDAPAITDIGTRRTFPEDVAAELNSTFGITPSAETATSIASLVERVKDGDRTAEDELLHVAQVELVDASQEFTAVVRDFTTPQLQDVVTRGRTANLSTEDMQAAAEELNRRAETGDPGFSDVPENRISGVARAFAKTMDSEMIARQMSNPNQDQDVRMAMTNELESRQRKALSLKEVVRNLDPKRRSSYRNVVRTEAERRIVDSVLNEEAPTEETSAPTVAPKLQLGQVVRMPSTGLAVRVEGIVGDTYTLQPTQDANAPTIQKKASFLDRRVRPLGFEGAILYDEDYTPPPPIRQQARTTAPVTTDAAPANPFTEPDTTPVDFDGTSLASATSGLGKRLVPLQSLGNTNSARATRGLFRSMRKWVDQTGLGGRTRVFEQAMRRVGGELESAGLLVNTFQRRLESAIKESGIIINEDGSVTDESVDIHVIGSVLSSGHPSRLLPDAVNEALLDYRAEIQAVLQKMVSEGQISKEDANKLLGGTSSYFATQYLDDGPDKWIFNFIEENPQAFQKMVEARIESVKGHYEEFNRVYQRDVIPARRQIADLESQIASNESARQSMLERDLDVARLNSEISLHQAQITEIERQIKESKRNAARLIGAVNESDAIERATAINQGDYKIIEDEVREELIDAGREYHLAHQQHQLQPMLFETADLPDNLKTLFKISEDPISRMHNTLMIATKNRAQKTMLRFMVDAYHADNRERFPETTLSRITSDARDNSLMIDNVPYLMAPKGMSDLQDSARTALDGAGMEYVVIDVPSSHWLHPLNGHFILGELNDQLEPVGSFWSGSWWREMLGAANSEMKSWLTVYNPSTHAANLVSNLVMMANSGNLLGSPAQMRFAIDYAKALMRSQKKGVRLFGKRRGFKIATDKDLALAQEVARAGMIQGSVVLAEVRDVLETSWDDAENPSDYLKRRTRGLNRLVKKKFGLTWQEIEDKLLEHGDPDLKQLPEGVASMRDFARSLYEAEDDMMRAYLYGMEKYRLLNFKQYRSANLTEDELTELGTAAESGDEQAQQRLDLYDEVMELVEFEAGQRGRDLLPTYDRAARSVQMLRRSVIGAFPAFAAESPRIWIMATVTGARDSNRGRYVYDERGQLLLDENGSPQVAPVMEWDVRRIVSGGARMAGSLGLSAAIANGLPELAEELIERVIPGGEGIDPDDERLGCLNEFLPAWDRYTPGKGYARDDQGNIFYLTAGRIIPIDHIYAALGRLQDGEPLGSLEEILSPYLQSAPVISAITRILTGNRADFVEEALGEDRGQFRDDRESLERQLDDTVAYTTKSVLGSDLRRITGMTRAPRDIPFAAHIGVNALGLSLRQMTFDEPGSDNPAFWTIKPVVELLRGSRSEWRQWQEENPSADETASQAKYDEMNETYRANAARLMEIDGDLKCIGQLRGTRDNGQPYGDVNERQAVFRSAGLAMRDYTLIKEGRLLDLPR